MPASLDDLTAVIRAERDIADRYRRAAARMYTVLAIDGASRAQYDIASAEEDAALRAMGEAQLSVDQAVSALATVTLLSLPAAP